MVFNFNWKKKRIIHQFQFIYARLIESRVQLHLSYKFKVFYTEIDGNIKYFDIFLPNWKFCILLAYWRKPDGKKVMQVWWVHSDTWRTQRKKKIAFASIHLINEHSFVIEFSFTLNEQKTSHWMRIFHEIQGSLF